MTVRTSWFHFMPANFIILSLHLKLFCPQPHVHLPKVVKNPWTQGAATHRHHAPQSTNVTQWATLVHGNHNGKEWSSRTQGHDAHLSWQERKHLKCTTNLHSFLVDSRKFCSNRFVQQFMRLRHTGHTFGNALVTNHYVKKLTAFPMSSAKSHEVAEGLWKGGDCQLSLSLTALTRSQHERPLSAIIACSKDPFMQCDPRPFPFPLPSI